MQTFEHNKTLALETKQFELWFQPVYDLSQGTVIHNEILLRRRDVNGHLQGPRDFMPEYFGDCREQWLDRFVLRSAVKVLEDNPKANLSINLSRSAIKDLQITQVIYDLMAEFYINPNRLHIEFAEKNISRDPKSYISLVRDLKEIGCRVVLDNFANDYLTFVQWQIGLEMVSAKKWS